MMPFPSSIKYASYYQYYPQQTDQKGLKFKDYVRFLKQDRMLKIKDTQLSTVEYLVDLLVKEVTDYEFLLPYFSKATALVPAVGSGPRKDQSSLWVPLRICEELHNAGIGTVVFPCLSRETQVAKSSTAKPEDRPKAKDHYDSIKVLERSLPLGVQSLTIVDDVVTRGATMLGMYQSLHEAFPSVPIYCFSLFRVTSGIVQGAKDPHEGTIRLSGVDTFRD